MRRAVCLAIALAVAGFAGNAYEATAQSNTTAATSITVVPDGSSRTGYVYGGSNAWFVANLKAGHSYVITAAEGNERSTSHSGSFVSGFLALVIYGSDGATQLPGTNFRADENPAVRVNNSALGGNTWAGGWRYTYTPATSGDVFLKVYPLYTSNASDWVSYRVSIIDTTLGCTYYYTSPDYESFLEVMNSSDGGVTFTATFYSAPASSGGSIAALGTYTFTLAPMATTLVLAKGHVGVPVYNRGAVKITHNGPAGALKGNITTINLTGIGLTHSFNTACEPMFAHPSVAGVNF